MKKLLLLFLLLTSCAKRTYHIDSELMPIVQIFLNEGMKRGLYYSVNEIDIVYDTLKSPKVGVCEKSIDGMNKLYRKIKVDRTYWMYNQVMREQLMTHELGHCILNRPHISTYKYGLPVSVMNPYVLDEWEFRVNRTYYYNELFGRYINE